MNLHQRSHVRVNAGDFSSEFYHNFPKRRPFVQVLGPARLQQLAAWPFGLPNRRSVSFVEDAINKHFWCVETHGWFQSKDIPKYHGPAVDIGFLVVWAVETDFWGHVPNTSRQTSEKVESIFVAGHILSQFFSQTKVKEFGNS
jgi:hypothetical protein